MAVKNYIAYIRFSADFPINNHSSRVYVPIVIEFPGSAYRRDYVADDYFAEDYVTGDWSHFVDSKYIHPNVDNGVQSYSDNAYFSQDYVS